MKKKLEPMILRVLAQVDGMPMPDEALINAARLMGRHLAPKVEDVTEALLDLKAAGYIQEESDDVMGKSWTLTEKGKHKAKQLQ